VVAALCQHLDGLPLAIELAAVRMRVLTVEELLERQDERYEILTAKRRGPSPRHHSLRAMVDWSFELCTEQEQLLWARMSVFAGGCDLPAVEDICTDSVLSPDAVLDALTGLVEKSIAVREDSGGAVRYRMLETLRQYGLEHLRLGGDEAQVRRRHRDHYLRLADRIEQQWFGRDQVVLFGSAREEHPNLRAAMEYSLAEPGQATAAMHMAAALYSYWITCGLLQEGFHWLERALEGDPRRGLQRAEALWATGFLTLIGGNPKVLASSPTRRADDIAIKGGEMHVATSMLGECLEIAAELNSQEWTAHATYTLGFGILIGSQDPTGFSMLTDGIEMERQLGSSNPRLCFAQYMLAEALTLGGLTEQAIPIGEECLATCRAVGDEWLQSWIHLFLGLGRWIQEEHTQASAHLEDCIRLKQPFHELLGIAAAMEFLSWCAVAMGDAERGARLSGAVQVILKPLGAPPASFAPILGWREKVVLQAIAVLGESTYEQIYRSAMQFSADEAIAYALGTAGPHSAERPAGSESPLTPREEQVAEMIADGLSNKEISEQLVISQRTAETHAANILKKLGYVSRTQVAVWTTERRRQSPADRRPA
jgi:non-specific serine/threonine protein kinase